MEVIAIIARMSRKISSFFVARGIVPEKDWEVYVYSFEVLLSTMVSFLVLALYAIVSRTALYTAAFMLGFVPLRLFAGGYHAKNHLRCFLLLMSTYSAFLAFIFFLPPGFYLAAITSVVLISIVFVFLLAPSEDINKPLSIEEAARFRKKSRYAILAYAVLISLAIAFVPDGKVPLSLAMGVFTVGMSLLASFVKRQRL